jgi:transposase
LDFLAVRRGHGRAWQRERRLAALEPGSWFTRDFEDTVALLAQKMDKSSICELMAIAWQTVGAIMARVVARRGPGDLLDDLTAIGIDEISYKRHHRSQAA